jgi:hypothetical protein
MLYRLLIAAVCVVSLAGCQQAGLGNTSSSGITAPSSLSIKAVDVPLEGAVEGEVTFNNTSYCNQGFTADITATGTVSHLGLSTWKSRHCVFKGVVSKGELELTAANGDTLRATYTASCVGNVVGEPIVCTGPAIIVPGTGRFDDATGTAQFRGTIMNQPTLETRPGRWEVLNGAIRY